MSDVSCVDGSRTMMVDGMFLHPPAIGARHSVDVHVTPILDLLKGSIRVLDIGFGVGWTAAALIDECLRRKCSLELVGVEKSREVYDRRHVIIPPFESHKYLRGEMYEGLVVDVCIGDASESMGTLGMFTIIMLDGWNELKTPELYSEEFLKKCYDSLKQYGAITVNTGSWNVRENLFKAGFRVETVKHAQYESFVGWKE